VEALMIHSQFNRDNSGRPVDRIPRRAARKPTSRAHRIAVFHSMTCGRGGGSAPVVSMAAGSLSSELGKYNCGAPQCGQKEESPGELPEERGNSPPHRWQSSVICL
jgi:hypothetical protein